MKGVPAIVEGGESRTQQFCRGLDATRVRACCGFGQGKGAHRAVAEIAEKEFMAPFSSRELIECRAHVGHELCKEFPGMLEVRNKSDKISASAGHACPVESPKEVCGE